MNQATTINQFLGTAPPDEEANTSVVVIEHEPTNSASVAQTDFEYARKNLQDIIKMGQEALANMIPTAIAAQDARFYDATSKMIAAITTANKELLTLSKSKKDIDKEDPDKQQGPQTVNQNLFVGTTSELLDMLADARAGRALKKVVDGAQTS